MDLDWASATSCARFSGASCSVREDQVGLTKAEALIIWAPRPRTEISAQRLSHPGDTVPDTADTDLPRMWHEWVVDNLGHDRHRAQIAADAATQQALQGADFTASAEAAREAWSRSSALSASHTSEGSASAEMEAPSVAKPSRGAKAGPAALGCGGLAMTCVGAVAVGFDVGPQSGDASSVLLLAAAGTIIGIVLLWLYPLVGGVLMITSADLVVASVAIVYFGDPALFDGAPWLLIGSAAVATAGTLASVLQIRRSQSIHPDGPDESATRIVRSVRNFPVHETLAVSAPLLVLISGWVVVVYAAANTTTLSVSPVQARAGDTITVTATNVPPNTKGEIAIGSCDIFLLGITFNNYQFAADSTGNVSVEIALPDGQAPGDVPVNICWDGVCHAHTTVEVSNPKFAGCA